MVKERNSSRVLVVEDNEANIIVTTAFLELSGYLYDVARTGAEAVEKIRDELYLAVLMDLKMPDITGLEATRLIREHEGLSGKAGSYIIGLTAHASVDDRDRCLLAGMNDYLSKPVSSAQLIEKILRARKRNHDG